MKKNFVKPEMKSVRLRDNILAGSGECYQHFCRPRYCVIDGDEGVVCIPNCRRVDEGYARSRMTF